MKDLRLKTILFCSLVLLCGSATPAMANAGVPMIFITLPGMVVLLLPVVFLESYYAKDRLKLSFCQAFNKIGVANLLSTFIGVPSHGEFFLLLNC